MPWAAILVYFGTAVFAWTLSGFLSLDLSLTLILFPVLYLLLGAGYLRLLLEGKGLSLGPRREGRVLAWLALLVLTATVLTWSVSAPDARTPAEVRLFNLLIPATLPALLLAAWTTPLRRRTLRNLFRALAAVAVLNAIVSVLIFVAANLVRLVPPEVFFLNPRYPVILMEIGGESWVRTPGIFESGGSNGSFLLLTLGLLLAYLLFGPPERRRKLLWAAALLHIALLAMTLTRRSLLGLGIQLVLFGAAALFLRRRYLALLLALLMLAPLTVAVFVLLPDLFQARTFLQRLAFWETALTFLGDAGWARTLFGYGLLQSSMELVPGFDLAIIDNTFLGMLVYGGAVYVAAFFALAVGLSLVNGRLIGRVRSDCRWLGVANLVLLATAVVLGSFSVFVTNITESLPYFLIVGVLTKFLVQHAGPRVPAA